MDYKTNYRDNYLAPHGKSYTLQNHTNPYAPNDDFFCDCGVKPEDNSRMMNSNHLDDHTYEWSRSGPLGALLEPKLYPTIKDPSAIETIRAHKLDYNGERLQDFHPYSLNTETNTLLPPIDLLRRIEDERLRTTYQADYDHAGEHPWGDYENLMIAAGYIPDRLLKKSTDDEDIPCRPPLRPPYLNGHEIPGRHVKDHDLFGGAVEKRRRSTKRSSKGSTRNDPTSPRTSTARPVKPPREPRPPRLPTGRQDRGQRDVTERPRTAPPSRDNDPINKNSNRQPNNRGHGGTKNVFERPRAVTPSRYNNPSNKNSNRSPDNRGHGGTNNVVERPKIAAANRDNSPINKNSNRHTENFNSSKNAAQYQPYSRENGAKNVFERQKAPTSTNIPDIHESIPFNNNNNNFNNDGDSEYVTNAWESRNSGPEKYETPSEIGGRSIDLSPGNIDIPKRLNDKKKNDVMRNSSSHSENIALLLSNIKPEQITKGITKHQPSISSNGEISKDSKDSIAKNANIKEMDNMSGERSRSDSKSKQTRKVSLDGGETIQKLPSIPWTSEYQDVISGTADEIINSKLHYYGRLRMLPGNMPTGCL